MKSNFMSCSMFVLSCVVVAAAVAVVIRHLPSFLSLYHHCESLESRVRGMARLCHWYRHHSTIQGFQLCSTIARVDTSATI